VRGFDTQHTRNILDLSCVPLIQRLTHLPIIVDPSHATGRADLVPALYRASIAAGASGLMLEVHPDPERALSDGRQALTPEQLQEVVFQTHQLAGMMSTGRDTVVPVGIPDMRHMTDTALVGSA